MDFGSASESRLRVQKLLEDLNCPRKTERSRKSGYFRTCLQTEKKKGEKGGYFVPCLQRKEESVVISDLVNREKESVLFPGYGRFEVGVDV